MTLQYLLHCVLRRTLCIMLSVSERGDPQCGDPEHRITFCEINSIKTDNIGGYIIKDVYRSHFGKCAWFPISRISTKILLYIQIKHLKYSYLRNTHYLILFNHIFSENLIRGKKITGFAWSKPLQICLTGVVFDHFIPIFMD